MAFKKPTLSTRKTKSTAFVLAAVLLFAPLSGCKNEKEPSNSTISSSSFSESARQTSDSESVFSTSSPESEQKTEAETANASTSAENEQSSSDAALKQEAKIKKAAEKRIQSDIDLALWYVNEKRDNGSSVSFPYENKNAAYSDLTKAQKKLYKEMLPKIRSLTPFEYTAKEHGYTVLDNVLSAAFAICRDHPECGIYFDIAEVFEGDMTTALRSSYFLPGDPDSKSVKNTAKLKRELRIFEEECNLIVNAIPKDFSTYDKYRYLAALISIRTSYDNDFTGGKQTSTAYGAIQGGTSICQGYSTAFEYLCKKSNLWCRQVSGISQGVSHAWNLVKLESGTYHVDVTWADSDFNLTLDDGWQRYFMLTQEEILEDHEIDDGTTATGTPLTEAMG